MTATFGEQALGVHSTAIFLRTLFGVADGLDGYVNVSRKRVGGQWTDQGGAYALDALDELATWADIVGPTADVFITPTVRGIPGRGGIGDTAALTALWFEADTASSSTGKAGNPDGTFTGIADLERFLATLPWAPSMVVDSGNGWHVYFVLDEPLPWDEHAATLLATFGAYVTARADEYGRDLDQVFDAARVMRLPGTFNMKDPDDPKPVTVISSNTVTYANDEITGFIGDEYLRRGRADAAPPVDDATVPAAIAQWDEGKRWSAEGRGIVDNLVASLDRASRHPSLVLALGSLLQPHRRGVVLTEALDQLRQRFLELKPGSEREFTAAVQWTVGQRLADGASGEPPTSDSDGEGGDGEPWYRARRLTDADNAQRLVALHGDRIRWVVSWGAWLVWNGSHWERDPQGVRVAELAKDVSSQMYGDLVGRSTDHYFAGDEKVAGWAAQSASRSRIEAMVALARGIAGVVIDHSDLDTNPWLLNVANGTIDLRTGELRPADPADLITRRAPVAFDPDAKCPRWRQGMDEWFPDTPTRDYVQRLVGHALAGVQRDHLLAVLWGTGFNGKSVFCNTITRVLGPYAATPDLALLVQQRHNVHDTATSVLFGARLAVAAETDQRSKLSESRIKNLTGGDPIYARHMYGNPFTFPPTHSLWLMTNHLPEISGRDPGIWRRIRVVPWTATFAGNPDPTLAEKLEAELPGILRWAVEGALAWQQDGLVMPPAVDAATTKYRTHEDVVGRWLSDEGYAIGDGLSIAAKTLTDSWQNWSELTFGERRRFNEVAEVLDAKGCQKSVRRDSNVDGKRRQKTVWHGIGETPETTATPTENGEVVTPGDPLSQEFPMKGDSEKSLDERWQGSPPQSRGTPPPLTQHADGSDLVSEAEAERNVLDMLDAEIIDPLDARRPQLQAPW